MANAMMSYGASVSTRDEEENKPQKLKEVARRKVAQVKMASKVPQQTTKSLPVKDMKGNFADGTSAKGPKIDKQKLATAGAEIGGKLLGGTAGGALGGAAGAMSTAASVGLVDPTSQAVAGAIGGIAGGLQAGAEAKAAHQAAKQRAKAQHAQNLGRIEQEKDSKIQNALESMKSAFGRNLNQKTKVSL